MNIMVAETAGFCFGVKRAVEMVYNLLSKGVKVCTLGSLIHNEYVVNKLKNAGVIVIEDIKDIPVGYTLVVRSHGVTKSCTDYMDKNSIPYVDATCPFVKKIHKTVESESFLGRKVLIAGDINHPEIMGIMGYCRGDCMVFKDHQELKKIAEKCKNFSVMDVSLVAQTTFDANEWIKCVNLTKNLFTNPIIYDTICNTTQLRQKESEKLSKISTCMVVIGGKNSSNTCKLYNICSKNCKTFWIETCKELDLDYLRNCECVGITAGASTPEEIIEEVEGAMVTDFESGNEENENFKELLEESFKGDYHGRRIKGTVVSVNPSEIYVDVGRKQSGIVPKSEFTNDPNAKLEELVKVGDELDLLVIRTDDQEGTITLSKLRVDADKHWDEIEESYKSGEILEGVVCKVVKSGILVAYKSFNVFIPASHVGGNRTIPFEEYLNKSVRFKIIEVDSRKRRIVGSIKEAKNEERGQELEKFWSDIEVGKVYKGIVRSIKSYGVFVDLGCIDGLVHVSELTWDRSKKPSDVVSVGQEIEVRVKSFDRDKGKVSLSYKKEDDNPWTVIKNKYPVGTVFETEIVNIVPFGAFARVVPGVDGLIHISQIADHRIESPGEVLSVGQKVRVKVREIDEENKRLSLTMKGIDNPQEEGLQSGEED